MIKVGLTGGIGSGKTTVAKLFEAKGVPVFIADQEAKHLLNTAKEVREKVLKLFGEKAYKNDFLDNKYIASLVFDNQALLEKLNAIVHPAVRERFEAWLKTQNSSYIIYEAAILFETGAYKNFDYNLLVSAPEEIRIDRVVKRDKSSRAAVQSRMKNQWSDAEKRKLSDFIIDNINLSETQKNVEELHQLFLKIASVC
ncbi:dephospho-CoA kinase [Mesonia sp. K7]|uniref:dephospho-CoA kinase n=1 Tax=Mesonia sp. K7 TaxID=2218606 RepID=UPI000DA9811A|nr:dephospho-CoA kinase [Mesonia sp. K7]PZD79557.1 dephospho-CoA kinase [Mesonia sp. K7]